MSIFFIFYLAFRGTSKSSVCSHKCAFSSFRSWLVYLAPATVEYPSNTIPCWGAMYTTFGIFAHPTPFDQIAILLVYISITHRATSSGCAFYQAYYSQDQQQKVGCTRHSKLKERKTVTYKFLVILSIWIPSKIKAIIKCSIRIRDTSN